MTGIQKLDMIMSSNPIDEVVKKKKNKKKNKKRNRSKYDGK